RHSRASSALHRRSRDRALPMRGGQQKGGPKRPVCAGGAGSVALEPGDVVGHRVDFLVGHAGGDAAHRLGFAVVVAAGRILRVVGGGAEGPQLLGDVVGEPAAEGGVAGGVVAVAARRVAADAGGQAGADITAAIDLLAEVELGFLGAGELACLGVVVGGDVGQVLVGHGVELAGHLGNRAGAGFDVLKLLEQVFLTEP